MRKLKVTINKILAEKEKTPYWLAKESKISLNSIYKLVANETESIKFEVIEKICDTLDCNIEDILTLQEIDL